MTQSVLRKCDSTFRQSGTDNTAFTLQEYLRFDVVFYFLIAMKKSFSGILEVERLEVVVVLSNELMQKTS